VRLLTEPFHQPKLAKSADKLGEATFALHLAPANLSGYNMCANASPGCAGACLNTAGRGAMQQAQQARIRRTIRFMEDRPAFMLDLDSDIAAAHRWAERRGYDSVSFRLNGTSDQRWENIGFVDADGAEWPSLMAKWRGAQFYDYTKLLNRRCTHGAWPTNYDLTLSRSETMSDDSVRAALAAGQRVAVVFDTPKESPLPDEYLGFHVIDGRAHDARWRDPRGVVVGLSALGLAKRDHSGFVVRAEDIAAA
tara:strand:- start:14 stop:766 length:753 start_codon:yes stop_codon:yes gene_type:complete